ncbi:MAG TPA: hypothetical protein VHM69_16880 [Rubrobacter sp.]|nr:hypothetical protein [Rubrobacter sp.]
MGLASVAQLFLKHLDCPADAQQGLPHRSGLRLKLIECLLTTFELGFQLSESLLESLSHRSTFL